jgi:hypothetical protein
MDQHARGVIEAKLKFMKTTLCQTAQDEQCHSVLASDAILSLLWNGVALRREKTRLLADDRGKELIPKDGRKFLVQAVCSPINAWGIQFLYPDPDPVWHKAMTEIQAQAVGQSVREIMTQAHGIAELLRDLLFVMRNSNCDSVAQAPKALAAPARLARECAQHANARLARARGKRFMAEMYGICGPKHVADGMAADAEKDTADANILTCAAQILAAQREEDVGPRSRQRGATPREKWVCDQISRAMQSRFARPLDNLAAQVASMLLGTPVSRQVVRSTRTGGAGTQHDRVITPMS